MSSIAAGAGPDADELWTSGFAADRPKAAGLLPAKQPKSDRLAPKALALVEEGRSYRWIAHDLGLSKSTVAAIVSRNWLNAQIDVKMTM